MNQPCFNCKDRYPACHSTCKTYGVWRAEFDEIKNKRKKRIEFDDAIYTIHGGRQKRGKPKD